MTTGHGSLMACGLSRAGLKSTRIDGKGLRHRVGMGYRVSYSMRAGV